MAANGHFEEKTSDGHISVTCHPIYFVFGSRLVFLARIALLNLTAHELHELYYDRPTSWRGIGQTPCSFEHVYLVRCNIRLCIICGGHRGMK